MNDVPIDWLTGWFVSNDALRDMGAKYALFVRNTGTNKPAEVYDLETPRCLARLVSGKAVNVTCMRSQKKILTATDFMPTE